MRFISDIDECLSFPCGGPDVAVSCNNTFGDYLCTCKPGYESINKATCTGELADISFDESMKT